MLDTFYWDTSKSWVFVYNDVPLSISLCDNTNVITKTGSITGFYQKSTSLKFDLEIPEIFFEKFLKRFFQIFSSVICITEYRLHTECSLP